MTVGLAVAVVVLAVALAGLAVRHLRHPPQSPVAAPATDAPRVLFPFAANALSRRALDAALRLARSENATLMPVFLTRVPMTLSLDAPLPRQAGIAIGLQEAIEHRAAAFGVPVDARIERGRTYRHALRQTMAHEQFERIVVAAAANGSEPGLSPDDVAWLLDTAPGDIIVLRPAKHERQPQSERSARPLPGRERAPRHLSRAV